MRMKITKKEAFTMIRGSGIYSTGGGYAYSGQKQMFEDLFAKQKSYEIISIDELKDTDYVCTAYAVGSAGKYVDLSTALKKGLETLTRITGITPKAIFAGETNIDVIAAQSAVALGLPVLDADSNGGRAVPEIQMDNFVIFGQSLAPIVVVTLEGEVAILLETASPYNIETFVRTMAGNSKVGMVATLDHLIPVKKAKKILTHGIFTRSLSLGQLIENNLHDPHLLEKIVKEIGGQLLIKGKVTASTLVSNPKQGFLNGTYVVSDGKTNVKVFAKNENIIAWKNNKVFVTSPDRVLTIDTKTLLGIHNSQLKKGQEVAIIVVPASKLWRTKGGIELFHPKHFGFSFKPTLMD